MTVIVWQPATEYQPGQRVLPTVRPGVIQAQLTNSDFEAGDSGWSKGTGWAINTGEHYDGTKRAQLTGTQTNSLLINNTAADAVPGQSISAAAYVKRIGGIIGAVNVSAAALLLWYDSGMSLIKTDSGALVSSGTSWKSASVTAIAPDNARYVKFGVSGSTSGLSPELLVDTASWNHAYQPIEAALQYEAIQGAAALSSATEPAWPTVVGNTIVDGGVTWKAVNTNRVTWTAFPIMKTGATEPVWPTEENGAVVDNTVSWTAETRRVIDVNCPNTTVVGIFKSKVWAVGVNGDILRFSATLNPMDWSTREDAGYLPTGQNQHGSNETSVVNIYRGRLVAMSSTTFELWAVDEDPANNALEDNMESVGSVYNKAAYPVGNELYFLSALGVRSVGIAAGAANMQAGDIGMPVDDLVTEALLEAIAANYEPVAMYYPSAGQYWLSFGAEVFVYTMNRLGTVGAWSRYEFPYNIDAFTIEGTKLLIRSGENVLEVDSTANYDETGAAAPYLKNYFDGVIQWPWLEISESGIDADMSGMDIVGDGTPTIQIGYDQTNTTTFTDPYEIPADTLNSMGRIGMCLSAPSYSPKITYVGGPGNFWHLKSLKIYFGE